MEIEREELEFAVDDNGIRWFIPCTTKDRMADRELVRSPEQLRKFLIDTNRVRQNSLEKALEAVDKADSWQKYPVEPIVSKETVRKILHEFATDLGFVKGQK